jgi:protein-tyrosine phosphatase
MYGGPAWAEIAKTINQMEHTTDLSKLIVLIDHYHDLGHNTGKLLDKFPEWGRWLKALLDLKAQPGSIRKLLSLASRPVRSLATEYFKVYGNPEGEKVEEKTPSGTYIRDEDLATLVNRLDLCACGHPAQDHTHGVFDHYTDSATLEDVMLNNNRPLNCSQCDCSKLKLAKEPEYSPTAVSSLNRPFSKKAYSTVKNVLIICSGNTCRSPMAENILRNIRPDLSVISRGMYVKVPSGMSPEALEALKEKGIPVQPHQSQQVTKKDIEWADTIFVVSEWIGEDLLKLFPEADSKIYMLGEDDILDPAGGKVEEYKKVRDQISNALGRMASLNKRAEEQLLTQEQQNEIAAASSPAYVIAVNNYAEARKRKHEKDRAFRYAVESVSNVEKIDEKKLTEFINTYLHSL